MMKGMQFMLKKGDILDRRYLIDSIIGYGDISFVFKAFDLKADNAVRAVKEFTGDTDALCSMIEESSLMTELFSSSTKYNFIPNIIQRVRNGNTLYIVMEYIDGVNMGSILEKGAVPYLRLIDYALDICTFVSFIHRNNKLYCDMKPDNIMIIKGSSSENIKYTKRLSNLKFIDFGSVISKGDETLSYTPEYAAPEQFMSIYKGTLPDERTDVFNIGASLYHMATGKVPYPVFSGDGKSPDELRNSYERFPFTAQDTINAGIKRIILKCINDDPSQRYKSCGALYKELKNLSDHRHLKNTILLAGMSAVCAGAAIFSSYETNVQTSGQFQYYMDIAKQSTSPQEKIENYEKAIDIDPVNLEAYILLIDSCGYSKNDNDVQDALFTAEEKNKVLQIIHRNKQLLINEKKYEKVSFELGKLIWYHEYYGLDENSNNKITRMRNAAPYFAEAIFTENGETLSKENFEMACTYYNIGKFYNDIITNMSENTNELYINFWNDLHSLIDYVIESNSKNDLVCLETYRTALDALDSYSSYFRDCGFTYDEQTEFFELIKENAEKCNPDKNTVEIYKLKQEIQERYEQCRASIEMSFSSNKNRNEAGK